MTGKTLALTERDKAVFAEVQRFGVVTRDHMTRLKFFSSKTRANERLKRLTDAGYLSSRRQALLSGGPRLVYLPGHLLQTPAGRRRPADISDMFLGHQLGLVDIRIAFERAVTIGRWLSDKDLTPVNLGLIPDAYLEYEVRGLTYCAFVEYDRGTEALTRLERKAKAYLDLAHSGRFERTFKRRFFRVLLVSDTAGRVLSVSRAIARLTDRVIRFTTLTELSGKGPLASIWRRPGASEFESLTSS